MAYKNRILILVDWFYPGYKAGGPIQSCKNIVNALCNQYEFYVLTSDRDLGDTSSYGGIKVNCWITLKNGSKVWYASPERMNSSLVRELIKEIKPNTVYLNSLFSFKYSLMPLWVLKRNKYKGRIVLAPRGMVHKGAISQKAFKKKLFLRLLAASGISGNIRFHATDSQEQTDIKKYLPSNNGITIAGNIPNTDPFPWEERVKLSGELACIFISRIHPKKNLHIIIELLKKVKEDCVVKLDIYGIEDDKVYTNKCKELTADLKENIKVNFKGTLPHHLLFDTLHKYHLFILPTLGENFGHAIFEAMSAGCPVLISDQTPWLDIHKYNAGWALPLDNKSVYLEKILEVCKMDVNTFNKMSSGAYSYAIEYKHSMNFINEYANLFS